MNVFRKGTDILDTEGPNYELGQKLYYVSTRYHDVDYCYPVIVECEVIEIQYKTYTTVSEKGIEHHLEKWYCLSELDGYRHVGPRNKQITQDEFLTFEEAEKRRNEKMLRIREEVWNELEEAQAARRFIEGKCIEYGIS